MLWYVSESPPFTGLNNIQLYVDTTLCLPVHLLMDGSFPLLASVNMLQ
jgi:hypothetical protein